MLQEVLRENLETKLNNNSGGKVFKVGSYAYLEDYYSEKNDGEQRDFIYSVKNGYDLISTNYIPCMADFVIEYKAIPNSITGISTITVNFLLDADTTQEALNADISYVGEVINEIIGNSEDITDGTKTYHTVWNMDGLEPAGVTKPINGKIYTQLRTTIYITFSDNYYISNKYNTITLDGESLVILGGNMERDNEEIYPQKLNNTESKGLNATTSWVGRELTMYVNDWVETNILAKISSNSYNKNLVFAFTETIGTTTNSFNVVMQGISRGVKLGEIQTISFTLIKTALS